MSQEAVPPLNRFSRPTLSFSDPRRHILLSFSMEDSGESSMEDSNERQKSKEPVA